MAVEAICAGCGKAWKVPDPARTYKCKECGGKVAVAEEASAPEPAPALTEAEARRAQTVQRRSPAPLPPETKPPEKRAGGASGRNKILIIGGAVVVFLGVIIAVIIASQGPSIEERMDAFAIAWESAPTDDLQVWFRREYVTTKWLRLVTTFDGRGWQNSRPSLTERVVTEKTDDKAIGEFHIGSGVCRTWWRMERSEWRLSNIQIPPYKEADDPPSRRAKQALSGALAKFRATWNEKRYADAGDMVHEEAGPKVKTQLQYNGEKYESRLPLLEEPDIRFKTRAYAIVKFKGTDGDFNTEWKAVGRTWALFNYGFPKTGS
jgi:DNA-directed RNA polymerase subunit RPC12/RpoP